MRSIPSSVRCSSSDRAIATPGRTSVIGLMLRRASASVSVPGSCLPQSSAGSLAARCRDHAAARRRSGPCCRWPTRVR
jgi:hypothetical protein